MENKEHKHRHIRSQEIESPLGKVVLLVGAEDSQTADRLMARVHGAVLRLHTLYETEQAVPGEIIEDEKVYLIPHGEVVLRQVLTSPLVAKLTARRIKMTVEDEESTSAEAIEVQNLETETT